MYSVGIGDDISFDLSLIEKYNVNIYAYDPTPGSANWLKTQNIPEKFRFHDKGLADYDGKAQFYPVKGTSTIYYTMMPTNVDEADDKIEVSVNRLTTLCAENNHSKIDLLKLDIEGMEYGVIKDFLEGNLNIDQLVVEFHHRHKHIHVEKTREAISSLFDKGYRIFHISLKGREYSFLHERVMRTIR